MGTAALKRLSIRRNSIISTDDKCEDLGIENDELDQEITDPSSKKFDFDVWKTLYREKLIKEKELSDREKACRNAIDEIKNEIGYKDQDCDEDSLGYKYRKDCTESWLSPEELQKLKDKYFQIKNEENQIMDALVTLNFPNNFMKGSYVQQYRQLEAMKLTIVDTIINSYLKHRQDSSLWTTYLTGKDDNTQYAEVTCD